LSRASTHQQSGTLFNQDLTYQGTDRDSAGSSRASAIERGYFFASYKILLWKSPDRAEKILYMLHGGRNVFRAEVDFEQGPTVEAPITSNTATVGKSGVLFQTYGRDSFVLLNRVTMIEKGRFGTDTIARGSPLNGWETVTSARSRLFIQVDLLPELLRFVYFAG
jgi:hypothetical protein